MVAAWVHRARRLRAVRAGPCHAAPVRQHLVPQPVPLARVHHDRRRTAVAPWPARVPARASPPAPATHNQAAADDAQSLTSG